VRNEAGDKLGEVDGLIVDRDSGRTYYIVVNAAGWFSSKQFLLPIGQAHLDDDRDAIVVGLSKDQVKRFPGFDKDEFDKLTEVDVKRINDDIGRIVEPDRTYAVDEPYYEAWNRRAFQYPDWWENKPVVADRMADSGFEPDLGRRERMPPVVERSEAHDATADAAGRAKPGDVIGVETGGEVTHVGDTREDEDTRRENAEKTARKRTT
jgi:hypothetical protein